MEYTITPVSVGIDWLTVTAKQGEDRDRLLERGVDLLMEDAKNGNRVRPFRMGRFYGGKAKHVGVGQWDNRVLVAVGGALADDVAPELLALSQNCSRLDLQVSVRQEPYDSDLARRTWEESRAERLIEGRPPQYDLYARRGEGTTLYVGSGKSRYLARLYERYAKTHEDQDLHVWRYEVEAKRERAQQAAQLWQESQDPRLFTEGYVYSHFANRGVAPIFQADNPFTPPPLPERGTDAARSLAWLRASVKPALRRLDAWGETEAALRALGLATSGDDYDDSSLDGLAHP